MRTPDGIEIPPPSPDDVLYEKDEGFATITLNRPVVLNALNWSIRRWLMRALERAEADADVKAIILTGAGRAFSAGGDLQSTPPEDDEPIPSGMDIALKIWELPKPVIAAVNGYALGQGCELAGVCDITVAADDAKLGEIQIRHGFGPPVLIAPFLLGLKQAKELLLLGEMVDAEEARRLGLVNRVVPAGRLLDEAREMARKIAALSAKAVRTNKLLINRVHELAGFRAALDYRSDPLVRALTEGEAGDEAMNEHLKVLRDKGWEAFRASRDVLYRESDRER
jgi:enoyl-CoA hydratase/carnithine racemase